MVAHLLWCTVVGGETAGLAHNTTKEASSDSPCLATRDILLHYNWVAELSSRVDLLLATSGTDYREVNGCPTKGR